MIENAKSQNCGNKTEGSFPGLINGLDIDSERISEL